MRYIFPFQDIDKGCRIVIYGASQTGYDFYRQIKSTNYCEIIEWVDRQYLWWREMGLPVNPPESFVEKEYDIVILTAERKNVAKSMKEDLVKFGVNPKKIYWNNEYRIIDNIAKGYDRKRVIEESEDAILEAPIKYVNEASLDIVIRVLYAKDILLGKVNEKHRNMYKRLMMSQNNGEEPTQDMAYAYFTEYGIKKGWEAFDESFCKLVKSIHETGFIKEYFIPVDSDGGLINGRHRLAAAVANGINVWTREYRFNGFHFCFNDKWLLEHGFSKDEILEILSEYNNLVKEFGV